MDVFAPVYWFWLWELNYWVMLSVDWLIGQDTLGLVSKMTFPEEKSLIDWLVDWLMNVMVDVFGFLSFKFSSEHQTRNVEHKTTPQKNFIQKKFTRKNQPQHVVTVERWVIKTHADRFFSFFSVQNRSSAFLLNRLARARLFFSQHRSHRAPANSPPLLHLLRR